MVESKELAVTGQVEIPVNQQKQSIFHSIQTFVDAQRMAELLASSKIIPKDFQNNIPDVVIAMELANRMGASPIAVMQNLYIVHGKPGWSASFIIGAINATGLFSPLRFEMSEPVSMEVNSSYTEWVNKKKQTKHEKVTIDNVECRAIAIEKETGEKLEGPPVSIKMACQEGWYSKSGSKWKTMPELMLRYRAATFFGRLYASDILMGMRSTDEIKDIDHVSNNITAEEQLKADVEGKANSIAVEIDNKEEAETVDQETGEIKEKTDIPVPDVKKEKVTDTKEKKDFDYFKNIMDGFEVTLDLDTWCMQNEEVVGKYLPSHESKILWQYGDKLREKMSQTEQPGY